MSADPKKLAAMVVEGLPPPGEKKAPMEDEEEGGGGGVSAMEDFMAASKSGDAEGMFKALKTAMEYAQD